MMATAQNNPSKNKILIINIFGIGDILFTTPLLKNIKSHDPDSFVGYVCNKRTAPLLSENTRIDKLFIYERDEFQAVYRRSKIAFLKKMISFLREIKKENFDLAINLSFNNSTSFLLWAAGIKKRVGFNYRNRSWFLTRKIFLRNGYEGRHVAEYYLDLLKELGIPTPYKEFELVLSDSDKIWAEEFLSKANISPKKPLIVIIPGGGASWGKDASFKRWTSENFAILADKMIEKFSAAVILLGDLKEKSLCDHIAQTMKNAPAAICNEITITQCAALLARSSLVVANDGGPLHVAVAVRAKTVSIFGPVDEKVYGPYPAQGHEIVTKDLVCRPCYRQFRMARCEHHSCLNLITVDEVLRKVESIL
ncbi:MAG: lipopolysaccharide heptosyltransferase II [Candidatus Omnitrophota bacterium]